MILDAHGRPVQQVKSGPILCPRCRGKKRVASAGFGLPHPICATCGYEWTGEDWDPEEGKA